MPFTPPPPPDVLSGISLDQLISAITQWWAQATFGLFTPILISLAIISVFLKTRSLSATGVAAVAVAAVAYREWLLLVAALALAGLLWGLWMRSGE